MARWSRLRTAVLIYAAISAACLLFTVWLVGQMIVVDAIWHCSFFGESQQTPPEPSQPYCTIGLIVVVVQGVVVSPALLPVASALSLIPWAVLVLLVIDVVLPWWRRRRGSSSA